MRVLGLLWVVLLGAAARTAGAAPALARRPSALSARFDEFGGVHTRLPLAGIRAAGYTTYLDKSYDLAEDATMINTIADTAGNDPNRCVFMAAYDDSDPDTAILGAFTSLDRFTTLTTSTSVAFPANGAYWYLVSGNGLGFAPSSAVDLSAGTGDQAETGLSAPGRDHRLSWRMDGVVGHRLGSEVNIGAGSGYSKLIMIGPAGRSCSESYIAECDSGYGLACDCRSPSTAAHGSISLVSVSIEDDIASNSVTVTLSSNGGGLELENRDVRMTSLSLKTGDGSTTCTKYFTRRNNEFACTTAKCGNGASDPYSCSATITVADLVAHCGQGIFMETLEDGRTGFTLTGNVKYEDRMTGAFGEAVGTATHTVTSVLHVPAGVSGTLVASSEASLDVLNT